MNCGFKFSLLYCYFTVIDFLVQFKISILLFLSNFLAVLVVLPALPIFWCLPCAINLKLFIILEFFSPFKLINVNSCLFVRLLPHWFSTNKPEQFYNLWRLPRICFTTLAKLCDGLDLTLKFIFSVRIIIYLRLLAKYIYLWKC